MYEGRKTQGVEWEPEDVAVPTEQIPSTKDVADRKQLANVSAEVLIASAVDEKCIRQKCR